MRYKSTECYQLGCHSHYKNIIYLVGVLDVGRGYCQGRKASEHAVLELLRQSFAGFDSRQTVMAISVYSC